MATNHRRRRASAPTRPGRCRGRAGRSPRRLTALPPPIDRRSGAWRAGRLIARAVKSLITRQRSTPSERFSSAIENDQGWLVMRTSSPVTTVAMPIPADSRARMAAAFEVGQSPRHTAIRNSRRRGPSRLRARRPRWPARPSERACHRCRPASVESRRSLPTRAVNRAAGMPGRKRHDNVAYAARRQTAVRCGMNRAGSGIVHANCMLPIRSPDLTL